MTGLAGTTCLIAFAVAALAATQRAAAADAAPATRPAPAKIKVLIIDGFSNHNWKLNTRLLRGILEPSGLFDVAVSTAPPTADAPGWDRWRPRFADYDVVLQTCNDIHHGPKWPDEVKRDFIDFVKNGGGTLVYHSANNAFPDWPEYCDLIGLAWRTKAQGTALQVNDDGSITPVPPGEGHDTGHATRADVVVHALGEHPIHEGFPKAWKSPGLEVYYAARGPSPARDVQVLSYGRDPRYGQNWPLEWVVNYGKGRMYSSTFGHVWADDTQPESLRCADEQTLLLRALQWLAKRPITVPVPADFPTAEKTSIRPEIAMPE